MRSLQAGVLCLLASGAVRAAPAPATKTMTYNPAETFAPLVLPGPINSYRSGSGAPGPVYWQNQADYEIHARLDAVAKTLAASMTIAYTNNSPDALDVLWLQLDQNIYRKDARSALSRGFRGKPVNRRLFAIDSVEVEQGGHTAHRRRTSFRTRECRSTLPNRARPCRQADPDASSTTTSIPGLFGGRTSWVATKNGDIFDIAQWYPRMAVYDDIRGWDTAPYLGQEFYLEYGRFDYFITAPADMIVAGTRRAGQSGRGADAPRAFASRRRRGPATRQ